MLIAVLLFTETTLAKLAEHRITPEEIRQVNDGDRIVIRNPRPRVEGSVLMIGPTHGGPGPDRGAQSGPARRRHLGSSYCMGREPCADQTLRA